MGRWKLWDIQIWSTTIVVLGYAALSAFSGIQHIKLYQLLMDPATKAAQLPSDLSPVDGDIQMVVRVVTFVLVLAAALPARLVYLPRIDTSVNFGFWTKVLLHGFAWLSVAAGFFVALSLPSPSKQCACPTIRDMHTTAAVSVSEVPLAMFLLVSLWGFRFQVRKLDQSVLGET